MHENLGTLLMFWDYDTQWGADRSRSNGGPKTWGHLDFSNTERLLDLLAAHNLTACFAVVGAAALPGVRPYHDPKQIKRIFDSGHEIASHSFKHEWLPGLEGSALIETVRLSKDALEQCIGAPVTCFVPPYNQPFDYARRGSFSLSERYQAGRKHTTVSVLCRTLYETGYRFCRVAYRGWPLRAAEAIIGRRLDRPLPLEKIEGIWCARLNAPCGFGRDTQSMLRACSDSSNIVTVYGHPHSITLQGAQNVRLLEPFLEQVNHLRTSNRIQVSRPEAIVRQVRQ
ncbi:MAG: polysaccharide deacetylase family protein [Acidobacteriaceae bacterium]|nr:polysaccharide deacetylase family protein [Acidobacteriaceae bacterium]